MVKLALLARLEAKPEKAEEVAKFLESAVAMANAEGNTVHWFALRFDKTSFGVFDTFETEAGRKAHLEGEIAKVLITHGAELLSKPMSIERVELLGAKL